MFFTPSRSNVDSLDYEGLSAGEITEQVTSRVKNGSILLFHVGGKHTPEALPNVITILKNRGYRFVKLSDLLLKGDYLLDHTGRQFPAQAAEEEHSSSQAEASAVPTDSFQL